jgi:hypothetical protein
MTSSTVAHGAPFAACPVASFPLARLGLRAISHGHKQPAWDCLAKRLAVGPPNRLFPQGKNNDRCGSGQGVPSRMMAAMGGSNMAFAAYDDISYYLLILFNHY